MYDEDEVFDAWTVGLRVMYDYLVKQFNDADILELMNDDPECIMLLDDDWEAVREAMCRQSRVHIKID